MYNLQITYSFDYVFWLYLGFAVFCSRFYHSQKLIKPRLFIHILYLVLLLTKTNI